MAITPEQARLGSAFRLTAEEVLRVQQLEAEIDEALARAFGGEGSNSSSIGMSLRAPIGSLSPAIQASIIGRYHAAGWRRVEITEFPTNYAISLQMPK